jgi:hypothetical protein
MHGVISFDKTFLESQDKNKHNLQMPLTWISNYQFLMKGKKGKVSHIMKTYGGIKMELNLSLSDTRWKRVITSALDAL